MRTRTAHHSHRRPVIRRRWPSFGGHLPRRPLSLLLTLGVVAALLVVGGSQSAPSPLTVADLSQFTAGNIISDQVFFSGSAMSAGDIQAFIDGKNAGCVTGGDGTPCLRVFRQDTRDRSADGNCNGYVGAPQESAAAIIAKVAVSCNVSPKVLLVMLQKEQSLLSASGYSLYASRYRSAMGYGCPDTAACDTQYYGFQNQVYMAAWQMQTYAHNPSGYTYRAGRTVNIYYNPNVGCGSGPVFIQNQATAGLYNYTPYQPNAAALTGGGDGCSAYGNRNFWMYFTDWFGSTQTTDRDPDAPVGTVDSAKGGPGVVTVSGWTYDPNVPTASIGAHVYVDGAYAGAITADSSRPDVGAAIPGVGDAHGFLGTVPAAEGRRTVCVYGINQGAGYSNPLLGCIGVVVGPSGNPVGTVDSMGTSDRVLRVSGWTWDPDVPTSTVAVHIYINGQWAAAVAADVTRPDVGAAYPDAGPAHGYLWSTPVTAPGTYNVCAYAINQGAGTTNPELGCRQVTASAAMWNPFGSLDSVAVSGRTATLTGWALDLDGLTTPTGVHVYVDGGWAGAFSADGSRPDVGAAFPGAGAAHGFAVPVTVPGGTHQVCAYLINSGYGATNPLLACRNVTVDRAAWNPFGSVDSIAVRTGSVTVSGWAIDPDQPQSAVGVHVYVDGAWGGQTVADGARPDVAAAFPTAGAAHGYALSVPVGSGRHTVCVYAINVGDGSTNPLFQCRSITS